MICLVLLLVLLLMLPLQLSIISTSSIGTENVLSEESSFCMHWALQSHTDTHTFDGIMLMYPDGGILLLSCMCRMPRSPFKLNTCHSNPIKICMYIIYRYKCVWYKIYYYLDRIKWNNGKMKKIRVIKWMVFTFAHSAAIESLGWVFASIAYTHTETDIDIQHYIAVIHFSFEMSEAIQCNANEYMYSTAGCSLNAIFELKFNFDLGFNKNGYHFTISMMLLWCRKWTQSASLDCGYKLRINSVSCMSGNLLLWIPSKWKWLRYALIFLTNWTLRILNILL